MKEYNCRCETGKGKRVRSPRSEKNGSEKYSRSVQNKVGRKDGPPLRPFRSWRVQNVMYLLFSMGVIPFSSFLSFSLQGTLENLVVKDFGSMGCTASNHLSVIQSTAWSTTAGHRCLRLSPTLVVKKQRPKKISSNHCESP